MIDKERIKAAVRELLIGIGDKHVKENLKNIADVRMRTLQFFRG